MTDNEKFLTEVYAKHLGRTPDAEGLAFWKEKLDSGAVTQAEAEELISTSPEAKKKLDAIDGFILKFEFSVSQTNSILNVLGGAPYAAVANLIELIRAQGEPQFKAALEAEANKEA